MVEKLVIRLVVPLLILSTAVGAQSLRIEMKKDRAEVYLEEQLVTAYCVNKKQKYPYFYPVNGPASHEGLTTAGTEPYPHHHSLFFGCDRVNGGNYWQDTLRAGQIISLSLQVEQGEGEVVTLHNECEWRQPGKEPVLRDFRRISFSAPSTALRIIDFDIRLLSLTDLHIEKTNHSLFAARMCPALSVDEGGTLINASGDQGEKGSFGVPSPWCDYSGKRGERVEGLAIFQHPDNPLYPAPWFTRDYGFFSPTPLYWPPSDDGLRLKEGEEVRLRYRVVIHEGTAEEAGIAALFEGYAHSDGNKVE
ncbi:MAG: hypothetical protein GX130_01210 [Candidatus Hydrogenedens sp.]|jgi:hypothetical protein|nr:hypothetical protein [Candidatus Hydrogenedens sp.]